MKSHDIASVPVSDIHTLPELTPAHDHRFAELLEAAVAGDVPVYFAAVPLALCVPFDLDYRPDQHPIGIAAIHQISQQWNSGQVTRMFVYPRGRWFVVSDDYISLFAALVGRPDYVPCWVLGKPANDLVQDVQGPIDPKEILKLIGIG